MADSFGTLLRKCRVAADMSIGELARRINYSKSHLSKIENDLQRPNATLAKLCDRILDTGGELFTSIRPTVADPEPPAPEDVADGDVCVVLFDTRGELRVQQLPREHVPAGAGALLGEPLARGTRPMTDERTVACLRTAFEQLRTLGAMTSPLVVLGQVLANLMAVRTLARYSEGTVRTDLLLLASRLAEYAGWMSQEAGDDAGARSWTDRAVWFATAAGDERLASFALYRRAEIAMYRHDAIGTIELARRAQENQEAGPRILGLAAQCEAQGHAMAGDLASYQEALDRAAALLATQDTDRAASLGSTSVADQVPLVAGWSLCELGRPGEAAVILDEHVVRIPPTSRRARARFGARRALAHAQNGDADTACAVLRDVIADAAHVDSATVRVDLRQLARTLARWSANAAVREIQPKLMALLHTTQ